MQGLKAEVPVGTRKLSKAAPEAVGSARFEVGPQSLRQASPPSRPWPRPAPGAHPRISKSHPAARACKGGGGAQQVQRGGKSTALGEGKYRDRAKEESVSCFRTQ